MANVRGLTKFSEYFADVNDMFVIVGGVASSVLMANVSRPFRATNDIDLVIIANPSQTFTTKLKQFVIDGGYTVEEKDGTPKFYRFNTENADYPEQIEVFSNNANQLNLGTGQHIVPITTEPSAGRLSAILLEDDYFQLIHKNRQTLSGHSVATEAAIIPLKARAFSDITARGGSSNEAKKHRNDILKLALNLEVGASEKLQGLPKVHLERFLEAIAAMDDNTFRSIMKGTAASTVRLDEVISILREFFL